MSSNRLNKKIGGKDLMRENVLGAWRRSMEVGQAAGAEAEKVFPLGGVMMAVPRISLCCRSRLAAAAVCLWQRAAAGSGIGITGGALAALKLRRNRLKILF